MEIRLAPFLLVTLALPTAIVVANSVLGVLTPTTIYVQDEISIFDAAWRLVQGQRYGADFHFILGFGISEVAAALWRLIGPHYYVLRASIALFALLIVGCGCVVATRQLRLSAGLAALFCSTVAFVASGPLVFGTAREFGLAGYYNHLITAALAVLFVQNFANPRMAWQRDYVFLATAAFLLNLLFLVKISGLVVGLAIVVGGSIVRGDALRRLGDFAIILLLLAVMMLIDFAITGAQFRAVIEEYWWAALSRSEKAGSALSLNMLPVLVVCGLLACYGWSRIGKDRRSNLVRCGLIIAAFGGCQLLLNMTNNILDEVVVVQLGAAAAVAIVTWAQPPTEVPFWNRPWSYWRLSRLDGVSVLQAIPLLVVALVLLPEVGTSLLAAKVAYSVYAGRAHTLKMTAHKGITFELLAGSDPAEIDMVLSANQAVAAIEKIGAATDTIGSLDFANPFPILLLAPSPRGVPTSLGFADRPAGLKPPTWQDIIGNSCLVLEPKRPLNGAEHFRRIGDTVRPRLAEAFSLVYEDGSWRYWRQNGSCAAASQQQAQASPEEGDDRTRNANRHDTNCGQDGGNDTVLDLPTAREMLGLRRSVLGRPLSTERMNRWLDFLVLQFAAVTQPCR